MDPAHAWAGRKEAFLENREISGRRAKAAGLLFEHQVEGACSWYRQQGIASIEKTPEPTKYIRSLSNGRFIACYEKQAQPDFKGILKDGTCVVFDAKHTDADMISQSVVLLQQWELLDTYESMGGHCFILVSMGFKDYFRVPWSVWKTMKERYGHKHMSRADLWPYKVPSRLFVAFLEGIELRDDDEDEDGDDDG